MTAQIVWPLFIGMVANALSELAERAFLGRFSGSALAASLPGAMSAVIFTSTVICTIGYSATFVAQAHGAGAKARAVSSFAQGLWLTAFAVPFFLAVLPLGNVLIDLSGHPPELRADEKTYFLFCVLSSVFSVLSAVLGGFFAGQGRTRIVGLTAAAGCAVNAVLDPTLIFGAGMGIAGAGVAKLIARSVPCILLVIAVSRDPLIRDPGIPRPFVFCPALTRQILRFGFPSGLSALIGSSVFTFFVMTLGRADATALAVGNVVFAVNNIVYTHFCSVEAAVSILAGRLTGRGDSQAVKRSTGSGHFLAVAVVVLFYAIVFPFSDTVLSLFTSETSKLDPTAFRTLGRLFLGILFVRSVFEGILLVFTGALRGVGDTRFVFLVHFVVSVLIWTPSILVVRFMTASPLSLWLTLPFATGLHALFLFLRWRSGKWERFKLDSA